MFRSFLRPSAVADSDGDSSADTMRSLRLTDGSSRTSPGLGDQADAVAHHDEASSPDTYTWQPTTWVPNIKSLTHNASPWTRPEQVRFSFVGVNVIDVDASKIKKEMTVKIERGVVHSIEPSKRSDMQDGGWVSVDARGLYMCPGLIDCHSHVTVPSTVNRSIYSEATTAYQTAFELKGRLHNGFTTLRDVGGATRHYREATEEWLIPGPRLFIGGPVVSQTGGHADTADPDDPIEPSGFSHPRARLGLTVDGVDACLKTARKLMMQGADHIKICSSGGVLSTTDKLESEQFTVPEIRAIADTVRMMGGTLVTAHCFTSQGARNAIEGGVKCIEHGNLIDKETLKLMAQKGISYVPTLVVTEAVIRGSSPIGQPISPFNLAKAKRVAAMAPLTLKNAVDAGVNVAFGTDIGMEIELLEFELRAKVLPSSEVLKHATCNAAKVLGKEGVLGCIRPGAMADFLLLSADPLEDVTVLNRPNEHLRAVVKDGRCVRSSVDGLKVEVPLV